jgi:hypothetical protein
VFGIRHISHVSGSAKLLCAGFVLLLAGGIALMLGLRSDEPTKPAPVADEQPPPTHDAAAPITPDKRVEVADPKFPVVHRPATKPPSIALELPKPPEDEIKYREDGIPIAVADLDVLRDVAYQVDYPVLDCVNAHGGKAVTGQVITTYTVVRKKDEKTGKYGVVVENTGFEEDGTTITDPKLIECFHKTANQMKFPPSDSPVSTWVRRRITVNAGRLGDNWVFQHGYIR